MSDSQLLPAPQQVYRIESGRLLKNAHEMTVTFENPFAAPPNVVITPHWEGHSNLLGAGEQIKTIGKGSFTVVGGNIAPEGFYIQWIAFGLAVMPA